MNKITIVAFIFLFLHFMIKPIAHTFPTLKVDETEDFCGITLYETVGTFEEANIYESLDGLTNQFEDTEDQSYI